jgi:hypothetical protein
MVGVPARADILRKLGDSLVNLKDIFGRSGRPGKISVIELSAII